MDDQRVLVLDGTPVPVGPRNSVCRYRIFVGDEARYLTATCFAWLVQIAVARVINRDGVKSLYDLDRGGGNGNRYVYRLRGESRLPITGGKHDGVPGGYVRLEVDPKKIFFNHRMLAQFDDHAVRAAVAGRESELPAVMEAV